MMAADAVTAGIGGITADPEALTAVVNRSTNAIPVPAESSEGYYRVK